MNREAETFNLHKPNSGLIDRLLYLAGLDFHILLTLLFRIWAILAGGVTTLLIPTFLSPVQQGYFYTFTAVIGTQIFFELGLNHVLIQLTSQAAAHLSRVLPNSFEGDAHWRRRIASLISLAWKWNVVMAVLFFVALLAGGYWFFNTKGTLSISEWLFTWVLLTIAASVNLALSAQLAICEGLGEVGQIARLRLFQSMLGYLLLWALLFSGAGLWAALAIPISSMLGTTFWLYRRGLTKSLNVIQNPESSLDGVCIYRRDIFPLQWRIAISWVSGYFIFSFLTPVVFAIQGEIAAGRLGLALSIFNSISTVGISWISAKIPTFGNHIARKERAELNSLFDRQVIRAISATVFLAVAFTLTAKIAGHFEPKIFNRLPQMLVLIILSVTTIVNVVIFSMSAYMRAHREEPMLVNSITTSFLIGIGVYTMAHVGLILTVAIYAFVIVFIMLPWCSLLFARYRRRTE